MFSDNLCGPQPPQGRTIALKACDACTKRKVRCEGHPCTSCIQAGLQCTLLKRPKRKGPKGRQGNVLSELRAPHETCFTSDACFKPDCHLVEVELSFDYLQECIDVYFLRLYPTMPVLRKYDFQYLASAFDGVRGYNSFRAMVYALCAVVEIQVRNQPGAALIERSFRECRDTCYLSNPTALTAVTSFFLFASHFGLGEQNLAWYRLRESITFAQIMRLDEESTYKVLEPDEAERRRRLFWLLFVTERAYAIQQFRPVSLQPSINRISSCSSELGHSLIGFEKLISMFCLVDNTVINSWNNQSSTNEASGSSEFAQALEGLGNDATGVDESQKPDIQFTKHWLRLISWRLNLKTCRLSSSGGDTALSTSFPLRIAHDLLSSTVNLSDKNIELHGEGICEKVYDVGCAVADVMDCAKDSNLKAACANCLVELLKFLARLRRGESTHFARLMERVSSTVPSLVQNSYSSHPA